MHSAERDKLILETLDQRGFISFQDLEKHLTASAATIRRDLQRLDDAGLVSRVRGGVKRANNAPEPTGRTLSGVPFHENIHRNRPQKEAIGRAAAKLCNVGEGVMIDGGSTTLQMCPHLAGLNLQVLTNSLHIVNALLAQSGTRVLVPGGQVFPEQNIILSAAGDDGMPRFHAPRLFMGAASLGPAGLMQADAYVAALGSWSPRLLKPIGVYVPVYPVKGYSITVPVIDADGAPVSTVMDESYKVAITRLGDRIRVGGTAEISGYSNSLDLARRATLDHSLTDMFPRGGDLSKATFWCGLRPMTPDGPPVIGATRYANLHLNTGHGTLGWTMACGSARVLADMLSGRKPDIDATELTISRYDHRFG